MTRTELADLRSQILTLDKLKDDLPELARYERSQYQGRIERLEKLILEAEREGVKEDPPEIIKLPAYEPRMESGTIQFGDDWPGIFLRGDNAGPMGMELTWLLDTLERGEKPSPIRIAVLRGFAKELLSCDVRTLRAQGEKL